jgi:hypothetical protein
MEEKIEKRWKMIEKDGETLNGVQFILRRV